VKWVDSATNGVRLQNLWILAVARWAAPQLRV